MSESPQDFPTTLPAPAPALRALRNAKIMSLEDLAHYTEAEVLALHGMGPSSLPKLRMALQEKRLSFKSQ